jgi:Flp pilus assembly pilin Flp
MTQRKKRIGMCSRTAARFLSDERGQATTEYVLLLALVVLPVAFAFNKLRDVMRDLLATFNSLVFGPGI